MAFEIKKMSIVVRKIRSGIMYSRKALFVSQNLSWLAMEIDGSITMTSENSLTNFKRSFVGKNIPIRKIGLDSNGMLRALSDSKIQCPLTYEYNLYDFKGKGTYAKLLDDFSFGVYDLNGFLLYRAKFEF